MPRTLMIGGEGTDRIDGLGGDDLLVGGATGYDTNTVQLAAIMAAWTSAAPYATRVAANLQLRLCRATGVE